jgi:hypothetical protein
MTKVAVTVALQSSTGFTVLIIYDVEIYKPQYVSAPYWM